jgi:hypothetical protein
MSAAVDGPYAPTLEVTISTGAFDANWANCDRVASYLDRAVRHNRRDHLLHYNLLSSALNEILEVAFRSSRAGCCDYLQPAAQGRPRPHRIERAGQ